MYFWGVYAYETFLVPSGERWAALIQKELGHLPSGLPKPFYQRADVPYWAEGRFLPGPGGWKLVSDIHIPDEVDVWHYTPTMPQPVSSVWYITEPLPGEVPAHVTAYVASPLTAQPSLGIPVWRVSLRLLDDLTIEGLPAISPLKAHLHQPLHLCLILDDGFFRNILLIRSLRKALQQTGLSNVTIWTEPDTKLLEIDENLPGASEEENLIRLATYAFSAVLAGSQYLYLPAIRPADVHAARWSRAISHILRYEVADLWNLADPLAGSFYLEAETDRLAQAIYQALAS